MDTPSAPLAVISAVPDAPTWELPLTSTLPAAFTFSAALSPPSNTVTLPFDSSTVNDPALTSAPSIVTSFVESSFTPVLPSAEAPDWTVTEPSDSVVVSESCASDATFPLPLTSMLPDVFAVRLPFATSSDPSTVSEAVVLPSAVPTSSVEADATLELPSTFTAPPSASIVIAPLEARIEPLTSTPPVPASTSTSPEAPAFAPLVTLTTFPAVTASFLPASAPVTSPVASSTVNVPAFTSVPLPVIVTSFLESRVTPSLP